MIPKIIHFCWLSGDTYPENIQKCIDSWKRFLPDYEIKLWNKETFDVASIQWVKEAFEAKKYAFAADYIRFWALYNFGGIYLDSDVEVLKSFDDFLSCKSFAGFEYLNIPEAAVIGAEKGTDWIKSCMDWYDGKAFFKADGGMKNDVVPRLVKLVLEKKYGKRIEDNGKIQYFDGLELYPYFYFSPKNYFTDRIKIRKETVCVHRFASAWGPNRKRAWTLIIHRIVIALTGKKNHDRLFRIVKPFLATFNGEGV